MVRRRNARYYPVARVAHIERLASMAPADFLFSSTRRDWDEALASRTPGVERVRFVDVAMRVGRGRYAIVEIPEPLALPLLPKLVALAVLARLNNALRPRRRVTFVYYAIENLNQVEKLRSKLALPRWIARHAISTALRIVMSVTSKAAFGTEGALSTYIEQVGERRWRRMAQSTDVREFTALAPPEPTTASRSPMQAGFLGSFEERKGIRQLMAAWSDVLIHEPGAQLAIVGHGPLEAEVAAFAAANDGVQLTIDPPRNEIKDALGTWHVLVLLSRRTPTWREQIGLPILEGLSAGCEVVTTTETGIADWLVANGHRVVEQDATSDEVADSLVGALRSSRSRAEVQRALPETDGRKLADDWLMDAASTLSRDRA